MRVGFSTVNAVSCQPLRSFGKAENTQNNSNSVSKADFDALNAKYNNLNKKYSEVCKGYDVACAIAVEQADQYKKYVALHPPKR